MEHDGYPSNELVCFKHVVYPMTMMTFISLVVKNLSHSQIPCQHPTHENVAPKHIFGHDPAFRFAAISVVFDDAIACEQSPRCWRFPGFPLAMFDFDYWRINSTRLILAVVVQTCVRYLKQQRNCSSPSFEIKQVPKAGIASM